MKNGFQFSHQLHTSPFKPHWTSTIDGESFAGARKIRARWVGVGERERERERERDRERERKKEREREREEKRERERTRGRERERERIPRERYINKRSKLNIQTITLTYLTTAFPAGTI